MGLSEGVNGDLLARPGMSTQDATDEFVEYYLSALARDEFAVAFHALTEASPNVIPKLIVAFRKETDPRVKRALVEIIWNHRQPGTIPFLGEALADPNDNVWKCALDGLVALASPASLEMLGAALPNPSFSDQRRNHFRTWIEEAVGQVQEQMVNNSKASELEARPYRRRG